MTGFGLVRPWAPLLILSVIFCLLPSLARAQQLATAPSALGFGNVLVGKTQTQTVSLTNTGTASLSISIVSASGNGFAVSGPTSGSTLSPGQSTRLDISFTPVAVGMENGSVSVTATTQTWRRHHRRGFASTTANVALTGSGISGTGQIAASPANMTFGNLAPGTSQTLTQTLKNTGTASVTVTQANISSTAFTASGLSLPANLAAGQRLTFNVVFTPAASGLASGTLAILSNASNPQLNITLRKRDDTRTVNACTHGLEFRKRQRGIKSILSRDTERDRFTRYDLLGYKHER